MVHVNNRRQVWVFTLNRSGKQIHYLPRCGICTRIKINWSWKWRLKSCAKQLAETYPPFLVPRRLEGLLLVNKLLKASNIISPYLAWHFQLIKSSTFSTHYVRIGQSQTRISNAPAHRLGRITRVRVLRWGQRTFLQTTPIPMHKRKPRMPLIRANLQPGWTKARLWGSCWASQPLRPTRILNTPFPIFPSSDQAHPKAQLTMQVRPSHALTYLQMGNAQSLQDPRSSKLSMWWAQQSRKKPIYEPESPPTRQPTTCPLPHQTSSISGQ